MKILTDEEIWDLYDDKGLIQNARTIEAAVIEKLRKKADRLIAAHRNAIYRGDLAALFEEEA